jgi:glycosyltransferase involved in cell wall biosynthesis
MIRVLITGFDGYRAGTESVIMNWYRHIDRSKIQFDFLVDHHLPEKFAFSDEITALGGHIYREYYGRKEDPLHYAQRVMAVLKNDQQIAGVHMNVNDLRYITPIKCAEKLNLPIRIIHSHNGGVITDKGAGRRMLVKSNLNYLKKHEVDLFACSKIAGEFMFGGDRHFTIINNGIDVNQYGYRQEWRKKIRSELGVRSNTVVVGFVGRLNAQKNPKYMIDIFREYHRINGDSILLVVGVGEMYEECVALANNLPVKFLGRRIDVNQLYSAFDVLLLPSLYEGLPLVLMEAQVSGLKCMVSDSVSQEAKVTDLLQYESIQNSPVVWAKKMCELEFLHRERECQKQKVVNAGYDSNAIAMQLEKFYLSKV